MNGPRFQPRSAASAALAASLFALASCGARSDLELAASGGGDGGQDAGPDAPIVDAPTGIDAADAADASPAPLPLNVACGVPGLQPGSTWPMFGRCPTHEGRTTAIGPKAGAVKWSLQVGSTSLDRDGLYGTATIAADGTLYSASRGLLTAVTPAGKARWHTEIGSWDAQQNPSPAIGADGTVYVATTALFAVRPDGKIAWSYAMPVFPGAFINAFTCAPAIAADGTVYVGTFENQLIAVSPGGHLRWSRKWVPEGGVGFESSPAIGADGTIYVGDDAGYLNALSPVDGATRWRTQISVLFGSYSSPALAGGLIYIGGQAELVAVSQASGVIAWHAALTASQFSTTIATGPSVGADGTVYIGAYGPSLFAVSSAGTRKWSTKVGVGADQGFQVSAIVDGAGTVYTGTDEGTFSAVRVDGTVAWQIPFTGIVTGSPSMGEDGTIYVGTHDGKLNAIGEKK